jgi:hypothetical protein
MIAHKKANKTGYEIAYKRANKMVRMESNTKA